MRPVGWLVFVAANVVPAMGSAQDAPAPVGPPAQSTTPPSGAEPPPSAFDLSEVPEADTAIAPGAPLSRACPSNARLPGEDPGIVVCGERERSYASISKDYDKGGWTEPPLPPADPTTLTTGSCVQITCLPPPAVNGFSVLDGLYKIGKKIIEGE